MIETFYSEDLFVEKRTGGSKANHAVVFFHGFPGGGTRGMDLGAAVHEHAGLTTFVVNYSGLGQGRGNFGFLKSLEESVAFVEQLRAGGQFAKISLYGASWGGLVALNAASKLGSTLGSLILASPFSLLPSQDHARSMLLELSHEEAYPKELKIDDAISDINLIQEKFNPRKAAREVVAADGVLLMQAKKDLQVPPLVNQTLVPLFTTPIDYREVDQDHSFSNRDALIQTLLEWFN